MKKLSMLMVAILLAVGMYMLRTNSVTTTSAFAANSTNASVIALNCVVPTQTAFAPNYTITFAPGAATAATVFGAADTACASNVMAITATGVNGDTQTAVAYCTFESTDVSIHLGWQTPKMKLGGVQCTTLQSSGLQVAGLSADDSDIKLSYGPITGESLGESLNL